MNVIGFLLIALGILAFFGFLRMQRRKQLTLAWGGNDLIVLSLFFTVIGIYLLYLF